MTTETRGQNSWVNFGRHNYDAEGNDLHIPATEKPYATQKVDLLPQEMHIRAGERIPAGGPASSMGKGPEQALAYAREQIAAGKDVNVEDVQRRFRLGYGAAEDVTHTARAEANIAERPEAPPEPKISDILSRPDDVANAALERLRKRGTFSGTKLNTGLPPEDIADLAQIGMAKLVKAAQKIVRGALDFKGWSEEFTRDFPGISPTNLRAIWAQAKPMADRAMQDVKRRSMDDLDLRIPDEVRVQSADPTKTVDGKPFHDLELDKKGEGFLPLRNQGAEKANQLVNKLWQESIQESEAGGGKTARDAVSETGARPPDAEFWDKSFSLPQRARYWYELSGESFTGKHFDVPREYQPAVIDAVAGTSGGVEPYDNLKRGIGILAEDLQKQPVRVDLRDPVSARKALDPQGRNQKTLKYGSFSGTMQRTSGLTDKNPLTTNDVQVASMFGIEGADIGKNPIMYEIMSRFFIKMRDAQNAELGISSKTGAQPAGVQPWETWQMQAPAWVYERIRKNPAKAGEYDDYSQVFPDVIKELQEAGVPIPGGKITMETLMDPRTPNVMSGTREQFMTSPVATVEVGTELTARGKRAADLYREIEKLDPNIPWVRIAKEGYENDQRRVMRALGERTNIKKNTPIEQIREMLPGMDEASIQELAERATKSKVAVPSVISRLMSAIVGKPVEVSRIDWDGYGTYKGTISPNLRIPMTGRESSGSWRNLDDIERKAFLSYLGQDLKQDAMAASHFKTVPSGSGNTYSVFMQRYDGHVDQPAILKFSNTIGYPVNVAQHPNGVVIDVNTGGMEHLPPPTYQDVHNAAKAIFGHDSNIQDMLVVDQDRTGNYVPRAEYREKVGIYELRKKKSAAGTKASKSGGVGEAGTAPGDPGYLAGVRGVVQTLARQREEASAGWTRATEKRLQKHLASEARKAAKAPKKAPPQEPIAAGQEPEQP
jgi:hypothetical protein